MKIHSFEKAFLAVGAGLLVACALALVYATYAHGIHLPDKAGMLDPKQVYTTPPFDNPGVRQTGENRYEVVLIGAAWTFTPAEIRVPAGAEITFISTATDVLHGFNIEGTRVNVMLIPGQISRVVHTFREPGEYLTICHEYCGLGHHIMAGKVIVE
jgi:cytochrome c oxidase subunit II